MDPIRRQRTRQGTWIAAGVFCLFWFIDLLFVPDVSPELAVVRLLIATGAIVSVYSVQARSDSADLLDATAALAVLAGHVCWLIVTLHSEQRVASSQYVAFGAIFIMANALFYDFPLRIVVVAAITSVASALAVLTLIGEFSATYLQVMGAFHVAVAVFLIYIGWKLNVERYAGFLNGIGAELKQAEVIEQGRALLELSRTDSLTGLSNRRAIDADLERHWENWQERTEGFAICLIDIDFFKIFNDSLGHQEGDEALVKAARTLGAVAERHGALIGRFGGEEFLLLKATDDPREAVRLANDARLEIEALGYPHPHRRDGETVMTVSVGVATTRRVFGMRLSRMVAEADRALHLAKSSGRNCVRTHDPKDETTGDEAENVAALLRIALERDLVSLVYQPVMAVGSGEIHGVETLMRLKMLDGTSISPAVFIPVAERTGAIHELGRWALRRACLEIAPLKGVSRISVNVSAVQLRSPGFAPAVATILAEAGITGNRLALEITEGAEVGNDHSALRTIDDLRRLGVGIWLDDFGTGFAGLSWLRIVDFDTVKIDKSFLHGCDEPGGEHLLQDIVLLLRNRGNRVLVEGVETEEQLALLKGLRIDLAQGYHLARPLELSQLHRICPPAERAGRNRPRNGHLSAAQ